VIRTGIIVILISLSCFAADESLIERFGASAGQGCADSLTALLKTAEAKGMQLGPLENKVREGLAKKKGGQEIIRAVGERLGKMEIIMNTSARQNGGDVVRSLYRKEKEPVAEKISSDTPVKPEIPPRVNNPGRAPFIEPDAANRKGPGSNQIEMGNDKAMDQRTDVITGHKKDEISNSQIEKADKILEKAEKREQIDEKRLRLEEHRIVK